AVNTCLNELKRQSRRPEIRESDLGESDIALLARLEDPAVSNRREASHARELAEKLLSFLTPADRLILSLLHLEGRSVAEVSNLTGFSRPSIKVRAHRARHKLQKLLHHWTKP